MKNSHVGSKFNDFLRDDGIEANVLDLAAIKRIGYALATPSIAMPQGLTREQKIKFILSHAQ